MFCGFTPLHAASARGHLKVVRELLVRGAAVGTAAHNGSAALSLAVPRGYCAVARLLRSAVKR
jgi:ankyrin repeat protein